MTRRYKTSYKSRRTSSRFTVTFDAAAIAKHVQETCTLCNGTIEESPILRGVCYDCYRTLVTTKPAWQIEAEAQAADAQDWQATNQSALEMPEFGGAAWFAGIDEVPF